jgi:hypothetical protein
MSTYQHMDFCKVCNKKTIHLAEKPNHILHLLISIISVGIWIPFWILITILCMFQNDCTVCGGTDNPDTIKPSKTASSIGYKLGKLFSKKK